MGKLNELPRIVKAGRDHETVDRIRAVSNDDNKLLNLGLFMALRGVVLEIIEEGLKGQSLILTAIPKIDFDFTRSWEFDPKANYVLPEEQYKINLIELLGKIAVDYLQGHDDLIPTINGIIKDRNKMASLGITTESGNAELGSNLAVCQEKADCLQWHKSAEFTKEILCEFGKVVSRFCPQVSMDQNELTYNKVQAQL